MSKSDLQIFMLMLTVTEFNYYCTPILQMGKVGVELLLKTHRQKEMIEFEA